MPRFFLLFLPALAWAQSDVGLVNHLAGEVSYSAGGPPAAVTPYMKVRDGDRFTLAPGARLRVVYFQNARQESFGGPARLTAGVQGSKVESGAAPQVANLPVGVPQRMERVPELLRNAKLGGVQLRGVLPRAEDQALRDARAAYEELRKQSPGDDLNPELFMVAVLSEYYRYDEMRLLTDEMLRKQPGSEEAKALAGWVTSQWRRVK